MRKNWTKKPGHCLAEYAETLALSTLHQRLAALAQWHVSQGFPDPTKAAQMRQMLKGIRVLHPTQQKQAAPLQLRHLEKAVNRLERKAAEAIESDDYRALMRSRRDVALLLIGFWQAFAAMNWLVYRWRIPRRKPVLASPSIYPIQRQIAPTPATLFTHLPSSSLIPLLRRILEDADIPAQAYSSHSMRRGFATWAFANGWDIKGLMSYVGWRDMKSALRYVEASNSFGSLAVTDSRANALELDH